MRIIAGKYARRKLESPTWSGVRPLLSRLRQPLFDTLTPFLSRGPFLDLFGGTGAFAIEAVSRGAPEVTVVELDPRTAKLIQKNADSMNVEEPIELLVGDSLKWLPKLAEQGRQYAVISVTPPYYLDLEEAVMEILNQYPSLLQPNGIIFAQYPSEQVLPVDWSSFEHWRTKKYGNTTFSYWFSTEEVEEDLEEPIQEVE